MLLRWPSCGIRWRAPRAAPGSAGRCRAIGPRSETAASRVFRI